MNFSISDSIGLIGGWMLFAALMIGFIVVVTLIVRAVRWRDEPPSTPGEHVPDDDDAI